MEYLYERIAYLRGLVEGMEIDEETKEGKVLTVLVDVLEDMAMEMQEVSCQVEDLEAYVTLVDEDLTDVEEEVFDLDEYDFDYDEDDYELDPFSEYEIEEPEMDEEEK